MVIQSLLLRQDAAALKAEWRRGWWSQHMCEDYKFGQNRQEVARRTETKNGHM